MLGSLLFPGDKLKGLEPPINGVESLETVIPDADSQPILKPGNTFGIGRTRGGKTSPLDHQPTPSR
jgi:hypothetical protein